MDTKEIIWKLLEKKILEEHNYLPMYLANRIILKHMLLEPTKMIWNQNEPNVILIE